MPKHVFKIENGAFGFSLTDPGEADPCAAVLADYTAYTCQVSDGAINASPNITTETIPATWCEPEETVQSVGKTSFTLDLTVLQDPDLVNGISRFLFEHDTESVWFYVGLNGDDPPKAVGKVRVVAGAIGGAGRTTLTATVSLPIEGKPSICFGDETASEAVPDPLDVTDTNLPNAATFADLAELQADPSYGDGQYTGPAFTTGQYVKLGDGSKAHYALGVWSAGPMT